MQFLCSCAKPSKLRYPKVLLATMVLCLQYSASAGTPHLQRSSHNSSHTGNIHHTPYIILTQKSLHASHILPTHKKNLGEVSGVAWVECHNLSFTPSSRFESTTLGLLHRHAQCDSPKYCSCKADRRIMCNCRK